MAIRRPGNPKEEITDIYVKDAGKLLQVTKRIYITTNKAVCLVWEAIKSCFGKGFWINDAPWDNNDGWKN